MKNAALKLLTVVFLTGFSFNAYAQETSEKHQCTKECKKSCKKSKKMKKHSCTDTCTTESHVYKHGEKKHACDASCKM